MMPFLYSLGQHHALEAIDRAMGANQHLMAFLDDIFFVTMPREVGKCMPCKRNCASILASESMWAKPKSGIAQASDLWHATCWKGLPEFSTHRPQCGGALIPTADQGIKVLGTPLEHPDFVARHLQRVEQEQQILLDRIPSKSDVQSAWLLLLHCASARANYQLRVVHPSAVKGFARAHDAGLWQCLSSRVTPQTWSTLSRVEQLAVGCCRRRMLWGRGG